MKVLLLTGPGGDAQGWGDMTVTTAVAEAATAVGHDARISFVETETEFLRAIDGGGFDIVWSALYYITPNSRFIGRGEDGLWVADVLDGRGVPYVGSSSRTMREMINKFRTHEALAARGVAVPAHHLVRRGDDVSPIRYPAFVKPMGESRSVGINDDSVVSNADELMRQVQWIEREFRQAALVEDFMPGDEFTTLVIGNGPMRECLPGLVTVEPQHYGRHKVLRADLRGVGLTKISRPPARADEARALAGQAAGAMGCLDHVRIDIKTDSAGMLRVMEVNGIPGLKPHKSWAPQIYSLYHGSPEGEMTDYRNLIRAVVDSACVRCNLS
jgi:D-alanine-D-alanine ligase